MNEIACLIKEPTKAAKFAVIDTDDKEKATEIIGAKEISITQWEHCAVIHDTNPDKNSKTYNCSIDGVHFYGNIIIAGNTGFNLHDIILTPGFIEKYIPAEDKYERTV